MIVEPGSIRGWPCKRSAWYNGDMDGPDIGSGGRWLRGVAVRPVRGVEERRRWDALMREHHYLPFRGLFGKSLAAGGGARGDLARAAGLAGRGVQGWGARRVDRLDAGAAVLAAAPGGEQRPLGGAGGGPGSEPGVAGAGLGLRRLSRDMRAARGHPVLLAETFVDPSRFAGTCYRASNWVPLGRMRGFSRQPGGSARWREHGRPKEISSA